MQQLHLTGPEPIENEEALELRRIFRMQLAVLISVIAHLVVVIVLLLLPDRGAAYLVQAQRPKDVAAISPPIVFLSPRPPAPRAAPRPRPAPKHDAHEPRFRQETPPPIEVPKDDRYRMKPSGVIPQEPPPSNAPPPKPIGRNDERPMGGRRGGPLETPTPGSADPRDAGRTPLAPQDLAGRIRNFQQALPKPDLSPSNKGPKGGGSGEGGPLDLSALPFVGYGVGNLQFESMDYEWGDYGRAIYIEIWRRWHNRLWMTTGVFDRWAAQRQNWEIEHRVAVRFTILRSGKVVDVAIETPSGCIPLDASAADALRETILPRLPADFPREQETVRAFFIAEGDIRNMKRSLQILKDRGYF